MTNEEMFTANTKIAYKIAWQYKSCGIEFEDLKQICLLGLWKAVITFKNTHAFSTYAYKVIFNEVNQYLRKNTKHFTIRYLSEPIGKENRILLEEKIVDEIDNIGNIEKHIDMEKQFKNIRNDDLNKKEKEIFEMRLKGYKQQNIANVMNCSQAQISRCLKKIRERIEL